MELTQAEIFLRFGVALGIGFLIGLQREFAHGTGKRRIMAGERTFALLSLSGAVAAMVADLAGSPLILLGVLFGAGLLSAIGYFIEAWHKRRIGITSETAILLAFMIGVLCYWGQLTLAVAIGIAVTVILSLKLETDRFVRTLTDQDISATLQLAVISAIILPILPNQSFLPEPFDILNPFRIWLMVVFISAISFLAYVLIKVVGERGIGLTGLLGGIVSSTAVTMSLASRSRHNPDTSRRIGQAVMLAWMVMFVRVLVEVAVLNVPLLEVAWVPVAVVGGVGVLYSIYLYYSNRVDEHVDVEFDNPFSLSTALKFGLVYAAILLISRLMQYFWGDAGIVFSSIISGTVNMTAITLTLAQLSSNGGLDLTLAAQSLIYAAMSNTITKAVIVMTTGSEGLKRAIVPGALLVLAAGVVAVFLL